VKFSELKCTVKQWKSSWTIPSSRHVCKRIQLLEGTSHNKKFCLPDCNAVMPFTDWHKNHWTIYFSIHFTDPITDFWTILCIYGRFVATCCLHLQGSSRWQDVPPQCRVRWSNSILWILCFPSRSVSKVI